MSEKEDLGALIEDSFKEELERRRYVSSSEDLGSLIDDPFKEELKNSNYGTNNVSFNIEKNNLGAEIENPFEVETLTIEDEETDYGDLTVDFVKGLILDDDIIGYRIKTNKGLFDISLVSARQYGLYNYRVTKGIKVQKYDDFGKYMSKSEYMNNIVVPDISDNEELCKKIIAILLT